MPVRDESIKKYFRIGVYLKGINAVLQIIGGIGLFVLYPFYSYIPGFIAFMTEGELSEDPTDRFANLIVHASSTLSISTELFAAFYLLIHGVIKLMLVVALLREDRRVYPYAILFLVLFVAYDAFRYTQTHSLWLIVFSIFDIVVIYLIWKMYTVNRSKKY